MGRHGAPLSLGFAAVFYFLFAIAPPGARAAEVILGVGASANVQFDVGRAVCRQVQRSAKETTCEALRFEGRDATDSQAVLSAVRNGAIEVGLIGSDWQYYAFQGSGPFEFMDVKFDNLRALFSLHSETFTIVARRDAKIESLDDLTGKRVNIGEPGSGRRATMDMVMKAKGWTRQSFQLADELNQAEQFLALCQNRVQAFVTVVAHPNPEIAKAMALCDAKIVPVAGPVIDKLIAGNRFLAASRIADGVYGEMKGAVASFGVTLTAVSSSDIDDDTTYAIVKAVFDDLSKLKRLHPALRHLLPGRMMTDGLSAPIHSGAIRYYRERGMM